MTKEELKQEAEVCMHNALYWLKLPISKENVEQGGSYILKLLEPREKQIAELEKRCNELFFQVNEKTERIADLEKENAELKETLRTYNGCGDWDNDFHTCRVYLQREELQECTEQLTKAKEIIKEFVEWANWQGNSKCPSFKSIQDKAEQFIKDSEVEKC